MAALRGSEPRRGLFHEAADEEGEDERDGVRGEAAAAVLPVDAERRFRFRSSAGERPFTSSIASSPLPSSTRPSRGSDCRDCVRGVVCRLFFRSVAALRSASSLIRCWMRCTCRT